jgi:ClpP class serine protease
MRNSGVAWKDNIESLCLSENDKFTPSKYTVENGIATIIIDGTLTAKPTMFSMLCGGTSYEELSHMADEIAQDVSITHVVLMISSGGGEAYSCFSTASYIKKTLKNSGKKLITYVDGMMASAAYALGCISDEIIMNPDASVGSIGVVVSLMDNSKELEMEGLKPVWVYAGDSKIPYAEDGSFKQEFLDDLQKSVNFTYDNFTKHVSEMRGIEVEDIIKTQAKLFKTSDAITLGLADKQMTIFEFADYLASIVSAEETELPYTVKPNHHEDDDDEDEQAGS